MAPAGGGAARGGAGGGGCGGGRLCGHQDGASGRAALPTKSSRMRASLRVPCAVGWSCGGGRAAAGVRRRGVRRRGVRRDLWQGRPGRRHPLGRPPPTPTPPPGAAASSQAAAGGTYGSSRGRRPPRSSARSTPASPIAAGGGSPNAGGERPLGMWWMWPPPPGRRTPRSASRRRCGQAAHRSERPRPHAMKCLVRMPSCGSRVLRHRHLDGLLHAWRAVAVAERGDRCLHLLRGARLEPDESAPLTARALRGEHHGVGREELAELLRRSCSAARPEELHLVGHDREATASAKDTRRGGSPRLPRPR